MKMAPTFSSRIGRKPNGFTLMEMMLGIMITAMVMSIVAGLTHAVQSSWEFSNRLQESYAESTAITQRMQYIIGQCGVYKVSGSEPQVGAAIFTQSFGSEVVPNRLVLWCGGRNGSLSGEGILDRLPKAHELLIYTSGADDPACLEEVAFPGNQSTVSFHSPGFASQIQSLLASPTAERITLTKHLATARISSGGPVVPLLRFDTFPTPSSSAITSTPVGSAAWKALPWIHGMCDDEGGLRQVNLSIELQIAQAPDRAPAEPAFASSIIRYWHVKN